MCGNIAVVKTQESVDLAAAPIDRVAVASIYCIIATSNNSSNSDRSFWMLHEYRGIVSVVRGELQAARLTRPVARSAVRTLPHGLLAHAVGHHAAVFLQLGDHRLVQRDILLCGAIGAGMDVQLLGKLLARAEAGVEIEQAEQVDDRGLVVAASTLHVGHRGEYRADIDLLRRGRGRRGRRRRGGLGRSRGWRARRGRALVVEDLVHDAAEDAHVVAPMKSRMAGSPRLNAAAAIWLHAGTYGCGEPLRDAAIRLNRRWTDE